MGTLPNIENNITEQQLEITYFLHINAIFIMPVLLFVGCGEPTLSNQKDEGNNAVRVSLASVLTLGNPFFRIAENVKSEAAKHGYDVLWLMETEMYRSKPIRLTIF